ncbi:MAG: hypothetical protein JEY91_01030 [Spirochaetaceae bacterium]|nr:hypothetical protein [Spirochaetaceae bacterium]
MNLDNPLQTVESLDRGRISFSLGDYFGYFTEDLDLTFLGNKDYKVSISENSFINYPKIPKILDIQNNKGQDRAIIESTGYPVIQGDRIAVLSDSFISFYDIDGNLYWKKEILSIITSLSITQNHVLIGYLDGVCEVVSISGSTEFIYRPGGSRIEAVYSAAISSDSQYISIISGLDPQRFILLQNRKGEYKSVFHFELNHEFRRSVNMYFSKDDSKVFFESTEGVNVFDIESKSLLRLGDTGLLVNVYKDEERDLYSLLLKDMSEGFLGILSEQNESILKKTFYGRNMFFKKNQNRYYIGTDNLIMYFELVKQ